MNSLKAQRETRTLRGMTMREPEWEEDGADGEVVDRMRRMAAAVGLSADEVLSPEGRTERRGVGPVEDLRCPGDWKE